MVATSMRLIPQWSPTLLRLLFNRVSSVGYFPVQSSVGPQISRGLVPGAPCMTASSPVKAKRRAISRGGRGDVKGAVLWRSSRSLTSPRPLQQLILEQSSDVLSELCSILEKISFIGETTQTRMLIFNHLRWFPEVPSTMYSARNCTMISCSNSLLLAREAGCPIRSSAFCRNH
jgi:hypothetical protein